MVWMPEMKCCCALSCLALLLPLPAAAQSAAAAKSMYCCQDSASGRSVCGDTLPAQCRGRAYRVLDRAGNLVREVAAPLTPEQKAAAAAAAAEQKRIEDAQREQWRKDQALLTTYPTLADIDYLQKKAEGEARRALQEARDEMVELQHKQRKLANEAEFYKRRSMPVDLANQLRANGHEIQLQQELIALRNKELVATSNKYEADRKRYLELTGGRPTGPR